MMKSFIGVISVICALADEVPWCARQVGEVLFLFDSSQSFKKPLTQLSSFGPKLFSDLKKSFSGISFGVGEFSDHGICDTGDHRDTCYRTVLPLTNSTESVQKAFQTAKVRFGGDELESQLDALYFAARSKEVGWTDRKTDEFGNPVFRLVIVATDSDFHRAGDLASSCLASWRFSGQSIEPFPPGITEPVCSKYDHPEIEYVREAFQEKGLIPVFLISDSRVQSSYVSLASALQSGGAVLEFPTTTDDLVETIKQRIVCPTSTSTPSPSTTTTTSSSEPHSGIIIGSAIGSMAVLGVAGTAIAKLATGSASVPDAMDIAEMPGSNSDDSDREVVAGIGAESYA